VIHYLISKNIV